MFYFREKKKSTNCDSACKLAVCSQINRRFLNTPTFITFVMALQVQKVWNLLHYCLNLDHTEFMIKTQMMQGEDKKHFSQQVMKTLNSPFISGFPQVLRTPFVISWECINLKERLNRQYIFFGNSYIVQGIMTNMSQFLKVPLAPAVP